MAEQNENKEQVQEEKSPEVKSGLSQQWISHVAPHSKLEELYLGKLWQVQGGIPNKKVDRNMVVYKMNSGELFCHSVVALNEEGMKELDSLGKVGVILVPNAQHTFDASLYAERYPNAKVICPASFKEQFTTKKKIPIHGVSEESLSEYGIKCIWPEGFKKTGGAGVCGEFIYQLPLGENESAIVVTDALMGTSHTGITKFFMGNGFNCPRIIRWFCIQNLGLFKSLLLKLAEDSSVKIISIAHGPPIRENPSEALKTVAGTL